MGRYLKNKLQKERFHFFNNFFFRKLTDMIKIPPNTCDGKSAFLRVRKWINFVVCICIDVLNRTKF